MDKGKFIRKGNKLPPSQISASSHYSDLRVLQKTMVYCSGLPSNLTQDEICSESYFGQYGKVDKIVLNPYPNRNYCSVYLTFSHEFEAATAILVF